MSELNFETYAENTEQVSFYKVGIIGPSRVGKTSIIAALLDEAQAALAQTQVSITSFVNEDGVSPTKERIKNTIVEIESGLDYGSFEPRGTGTADPFIFDLVMKIVSNRNERHKELRLAIMDYPGGWLKKPPKGETGQKTWAKCQEWILDSSVIIVPIDATLLMEADNRDRAAAARHLLQIYDLEELVRNWAKRRCSLTSALLLFVPVKCETYFNNDGGENQSHALYEKFSWFYGDVIEAAKQEMSNLEYNIEYHPVDTIGCVEIYNAEWINVNGKLSLNCQYRVRDPISNNRPKRNPLGTIGLLNSISKQIIVKNRQSRGFLGQIIDFFTGNNNLLTEAIKQLSQEKPGSRFKEIAKGNIANRG